MINHLMNISIYT